MIGKNSSQILTGSGIVCNSPAYYYGFSALTDGADRYLRVWDSPTTVAGAVVESYEIDGSKSTDVNEHSVPVYCSSGIYAGMEGGSYVIYFYQFPLQKR